MDRAKIDAIALAVEEMLLHIKKYWKLYFFSNFILKALSVFYFLLMGEFIQKFGNINNYLSIFWFSVN